MTFTARVSEQPNGEFAEMGRFCPSDAGRSLGGAENSVKLDGWRWLIGGFRSKEGDGGVIAERMCRVLEDNGGQARVGESMETDPKTSGVVLCPG